MLHLSILPIKRLTVRRLMHGPDAASMICCAKQQRLSFSARVAASPLLGSLASREADATASRHPVLAVCFLTWLSPWHRVAERHRVDEMSQGASLHK